MRTLLRCTFFILLSSVLATPAYSQFYNGSQTEFGKNRIQYQNFKWNYIRFDRYDVYYNLGGKEMAIWVARMAQKQIPALEQFLDYTLDQRIQFVVYNKQEDFKQSNVGLSVDDGGANVGGVTRIVGQKIFLYYEGDHCMLEEQIRGGIAEVVLNNMMYGGNARDVVRNSAILTLPDWYVKGLISYVAKGWSTDIDSRVRDGIMNGHFRKFNHLTGQDAVYAGHSIWHYVAEKYSPAVIQNILSMTRVSRNIESAFLFVIGVNIRVLTIEWQNYFLERYSSEDTTRTLSQGTAVVKKIKSSRVYSQARISPDGRYIAYATNELGQTKLWLQDLTTGKRKRLLKQGQKIDRIADYTYPLVNWHPSGKLLAYIYEREGKTFLITYELETGDRIEKPIVNFIKVIDFSYSPDGQRFVLSAVQNGQTDIFLYTTAGGTIVPITKDIYDDRYPHFVDGGRSIVFSSNRDNDTLKKNISTDIILSKTYDLFLYNVGTESRILRRITSTPATSETQAMPWDETHFTYLSDENGVYNRYVGYFDSTIAFVDTIAHYRYLVQSFPITNYKSTILEQHIAVGAGRLAEIQFYDGLYRIYQQPIGSFDQLQRVKLRNTTHRNRVSELRRIDAELDSISSVAINDKKSTQRLQPILVAPRNPTKDSAQIDINNYRFDNPKSTPLPTRTTPPADSTIVKVLPPSLSNPIDTIQKRDPFLLPIVRNYYIQYATEYVVSQFDNSFLNMGYQRFTGGRSPVFLNPGLTALFKVGLTDLLEDHKMVGGVRLGNRLDNNEYLLLYEDRTKRVDKTWILHRQSFQNITGIGGVSKVLTHEARMGVRWPITEVASVRGQVGYRNDRRAFQSTDVIALNAGNQYFNSANAKIELVFDNTIRRGLNLYNGMRFKIFAETFQGLDSLWGAKVGENRWFKNDLYAVGFDFRYYLRLHRELILAFRSTAATSFGNEKLIYYMGGVDNWLFPRFDQSVRVSTDQNYTYQTLATPMRGYLQNIRNGNSFALLNAELRVPLLRYLFNRPMRSDFLNNFQVVGFGDLGTAWTGPNPYDERNSLNTTIIGAQGNPIVVILKNHKEPLVGGFGWGLRSRILGYFVRFDYAWGVEDRVILPRQLYLSFSFDF
jgi:WD40 repeat protein